MRAGEKAGTGGPLTPRRGARKAFPEPALARGRSAALELKAAGGRTTLGGRFRVRFVIENVSADESAPTRPPRTGIPAMAMDDQSERSGFRRSGSARARRAGARVNAATESLQEGAVPHRIRDQ